MTLSRRAVLAGVAATPVLVAARRSDSDDAAIAALDAAARADPAEGVALLRGIDPASLSLGRRLDVEAARAGLAIDAALATRSNDYALLLSRRLGTAPSAAAAIRRLDALLARLHARANALFDAIGTRGSTVGDRFAALFDDAAFLYPDTPAGRDRAIADMTRTLAPARAATRALVADVPAFCLDVAVRPLSPAEIAAGTMGYRETPRPDRAGAYVVDLREVRRRPSWSLPSVVAHELLPGHMVQQGLEAIRPPHPLRRTYATHFVEGWGIHAEQLAADAGLFAEPRAMLGHLHWLIFRAARGRIDLGIHRQRWTVTEARARLAEWQGVPAYFAPFDADLARIVREPAVRAAEALAWLAIHDRAPTSPARRAAWHRRILAEGCRRTEQLPR